MQKKSWTVFGVCGKVLISQKNLFPQPLENQPEPDKCQKT